MAYEQKLVQNPNRSGKTRKFTDIRKLYCIKLQFCKILKQLNCVAIVENKRNLNKNQKKLERNRKSKF